MQPFASLLRPHVPMNASDPIEAIRFRMEQQGLTTSDPEPLLGGRLKMAEFMSGKRGLSLDMIRRVHAALGISADVLIRPGHGSSI